MRPHYNMNELLNELLAQCQPEAPRAEEEQEWFDGEPVGGELI